MPMKPGHPCGVPGCPNLAHAGAYCDQHPRHGQRQYDRERANDPVRRLHNSTRWKKVRALVIARDPICQDCTQVPSTEAHHVVSLARGGEPFDMDNLRALCRACHQKLTNQGL